ncbi:MAG: RND transporter [Thermodesulfobacteriota bacterium]
MQFIDQLPWPLLIIACLLLGLAPFVPEPHLVEKIRMLMQGTLKRPIDIFDLFYHSIPFILVIIKLVRLKTGVPSP